MALNCNRDIPEADYDKEIGVPAGACYHCHTGRCPVGVATQDPELRARLDRALREGVAEVVEMLSSDAADEHAVAAVALVAAALDEYGRRLAELA